MALTRFPRAGDRIRPVGDASNTQTPARPIRQDPGPPGLAIDRKPRIPPGAPEQWGFGAGDSFATSINVFGWVGAGIGSSRGSTPGGFQEDAGLHRAYADPVASSVVELYVTSVLNAGRYNATVVLNSMTSPCLGGDTVVEYGVWTATEEGYGDHGIFVRFRADGTFDVVRRDDGVESNIATAVATYDEKLHNCFLFNTSQGFTLSAALSSGKGFGTFRDLYADPTVTFDGPASESANWYQGYRIVSGASPGTKRFYLNQHGLITDDSAQLVVGQAGKPLSSYAAEIASDNPSVWYRLDEASGTTVVDQEGALNGTRGGAHTFQTVGPVINDGGVDKAEDVAGAGWIDMVDSTATDLGDSFTVEFWMKRAATGSVTPFEQNGGVIVRCSGSSGIELYVNGVTKIAHTGAGALFNGTGAWIHVMVTKDATIAGGKIYVNGNDVTIQTASATAVNGTNARIGGQLNSTEFFNGGIDEFAVYKRPLHQSRAWAHYQAALYSSITAQAITPKRTYALGQASGTNVAQPITVRKTVTIGQATGTNVAQPITVRKTKTLGQASETETAQAITARHTVTIGQATEAETAQAITVRKTKTLGQATETELAQPILYHEYVAVAQASETDLAQPITSRHTKAIGQASETELAQAITVRKTVTLGQASETELAQAIRAVHVVAVAQASETDTAQPIDENPQRRLVNRASETELAQAIRVVHSKTLGQATETDIAQPVTENPRRRLVSPAAETDTAQPISATQADRVLVSQATETDLAQPITASKTKAIGQASETEAAQPITPVRSYTLGQASETNTAQAIVAYVTHVAHQASETDTAQPITVVRTYPVAQATETELAQPMTVRKTHTVGLVSSTEVAQPITHRKTKTLGQAFETDTANTVIVLDTKVPVVLILSGPTPDEISEVSPYDVSTVVWTVNEPCQVYKIKVVATTTSLHTTGTQIPTAAGSTNMSGGAVAEAEEVTSTIDGTDLKAASPGDGDKIVRIFAQDLAGNWSGS